MGAFNRLGFCFAFVSIYCLFSHSHLYAKTLVLQPSGASGKDAYIEARFPDTNYGLFVDLTTNWGETNHGLIEFDLSGIPAGSEITEATLEVLEYLNCQFYQNSIELHTNSGAWNEITVTWNNAPDYGPSLGTNTGEGSACEWLIFDVTAIVQQWVDGTSPNYGFRITGPSEGNVYKYTRSSDWTAAEQRPILRIDYRPKGGTASSLFLLLTD